VFEQFSERSRRIIFLARMNAGRRGAAAIEPVHLLDAIVREDQGEMVTTFAGVVTSSGPLRPPEHSFFSAEIASPILSMLERVMSPQAEPVADSVDMKCSPALAETLVNASALAKELHHEKVEPLHLVAIILSTQASEAAEILKRFGLSRETVIAAIES
jgi:ATP-dependent Clp protease ATP-binding subunit ClpA